MDIAARIENHTPRIILLPPLEGTDENPDGFPYGIKLVPGLNSVPQQYLDALLAREVPSEIGPGGKKRPNRFPGRELIAQLETAVYIYSVDGRSFGPQITVYSGAAAQTLADRADGPAAPLDLGAYEVEPALAMIKLVTDVAALKRYVKDRRNRVRDAANARLNELSHA
jgi:hypothetical protein